MLLQPLSAFAESLECEWKTRQEFILYSSEMQRFKIAVEVGSPKDHMKSFWGLGRDEELAKIGISGACADAKEFSKQFVDTVCEELSPHQMQHLINALQKQMDEWHESRVSMYASNPEIFGTRPPSPLDKHCPD